MKTTAKKTGIDGDIAALDVWEGKQITRGMFVRRVPGGFLVSECKRVVSRVGSLGSVDYESQPVTTTFVPAS